MPLSLRYRINEGISIEGILENGKRRTFDMVVRKIEPGDENDQKIKVFLGFYNSEDNLNLLLKIHQGRRIRNIGGIKYDLFFGVQYPVCLDSVILDLFAPEEVKISQRRRYPIPKNFEKAFILSF